MAVPAKKVASYQDVLDAPEHWVAEILDGDLHLSPRPAKRHAVALAALHDELGPPFRRGRGGPGGWIILEEPELHLAADILVPDLAGWRVQRMPVLDDQAYFTEVPDWIAEVLSPATAKRDRTDKLRIYAREGVRWAWLVDPSHRTLEVLRLQDQQWLLLGAWRDDERVRAEPFDAIELELSTLWEHVVPGEP